MTIEIKILFFTVILGIVQLLVATHLATGQRGMKWNFSPRDEKMPDLSGVAGRMDRAFRNLMETFAFFAVLVILVQVTGRANSMTALGAEIYFAARLIYVPLYAVGVPVVRTLIWVGSLVGILMIGSALF